MTQLLDADREELKPCPFCGGEAEFERKGTSRVSCIVCCTCCGARHESGDVNEMSGMSWNRRSGEAVPTEGWKLVPTTATEEQIDAALIYDAPHVQRDKGERENRATDYSLMVDAAPVHPSTLVEHRKQQEIGHVAVQLGEVSPDRNAG